MASLKEIEFLEFHVYNWNIAEGLCLRPMLRSLTIQVYPSSKLKILHHQSNC